MTEDEHRERHKLLHSMFDELLADYLLAVPGSLPSKISVMELLSWSHQQTIHPTPAPALAAMN